MNVLFVKLRFAFCENTKHIDPSLQEYEENQTPESKFVKDLDRLDMVLQAFEYEKRDQCPQQHQEFFDSTEGKFNHPFVVKLVEEINAQRAELSLDKDSGSNSTSVGHATESWWYGRRFDDDRPGVTADSVRLACSQN